MTAVQRDFLAALVPPDRGRAVEVARAALAAGLEPASLYCDVIGGSLYEIGRRWQANELTVAQEHAATATVQYVLSAIYADLPREESDRGRAVVAGVPGEQHQVGLHIVADLLELDGWSTRFLGADVPIEPLLQAVDEHEATLVGLGTTMAHHLPALEAAVSALTSRFGETTVVLGGQAAALVDPVSLGAHAYLTDPRGLGDVVRAAA